MEPRLKSSQNIYELNQMSLYNATYLFIVDAYLYNTPIFSNTYRSY